VIKYITQTRSSFSGVRIFMLFNPLVRWASIGQIMKTEKTLGIIQILEVCASFIYL